MGQILSKSEESHPRSKLEVRSHAKTVTLYIGETNRTLEKRIKCVVKTGDGKNGVAVHVWGKEHRVNVGPIFEVEMRHGEKLCEHCG